MTAEDVQRKIGLLRQVSTQNGASAAEAENAARLAKALMDRHVAKTPGSTRPHEPAFRLTWVYWQYLFDEFGLQFSHFGYRGSAKIGNDRMVHITLNSGQWSVEKRSTGGPTNVLARGRGVESMRKYLSQHARSYSFFKF